MEQIGGGVSGRSRLSALCFTKPQRGDGERGKKKKKPLQVANLVFNHCVHLLLCSCSIEMIAAINQSPKNYNKTRSRTPRAVSRVTFPVPMWCHDNNRNLFPTYYKQSFRRLNRKNKWQWRTTPRPEMVSAVDPPLGGACWSESLGIHQMST